MHRTHWLAAFAILPAILLFLSAPGCGKKEDKPADMTGTPTPPDKKGTDTTKTSGKKTPIATGDAVVKGRVTYAGEKPSEETLKAIKEAKDMCVAPNQKENIDQRYLVDADKGIANVLVMLKPAKDQYFQVADADKKRTEPAVLDQPHCAFVPHVLAMYPAYYDGSKRVPTGQKLLVKNSAPFSHNTKISLGLKGDFNPTIAAGGSKELEIDPGTTPYQVSCSIHGWMNAYIWALDHPYFAVTDEKGNFEIKNVPTGTELTVLAWHEVPAWIYGGAEGKKMTFKSGENKIDDIVVPAK